MEKFPLKRYQVLPWLVKNFLHCLKPGYSLPYVQEPVASTYSEPDKSNPSDILLSTLILFSHLRLGVPNCLFSSGFPIRTLYATLLSHIRATCPAHFIILDLIPRRIFGDGYRSLSSYLCSLMFPLLPRPSQAQIPFSPPYYRTPSACVSHSSSEINTHTIWNTNQNYISVYLYFYVSGQILHRMIANIS